MTEISVILFDLNGVLYRYERDDRIAYLSSISDLSPGAVKAAIWDSGFEDTGDAGALDASAYLRGFGASLDYALTEADWVAAQLVSVAPIAATHALLARIRCGVRCAVLTNNNLLVKRHFGALYPEIAAWVGDRAYVSAEFGARKPDPDVYRRCVACLAVEPAATLFIDDNLANVDGARAAGLCGYHTISAEDLEVEFRARALID